MNFFWSKKNTQPKPESDGNPSVDDTFSTEPRASEHLSGEPGFSGNPSSSSPEQMGKPESRPENASFPVADVPPHDEKRNCSVCSNPKILDTLFSQFQEQINKQIHTAKDLSEKEILAIGDCVNNIVEHARDYIKESHETFEKNFSEQNVALENYLDFSKTTLEKQSNTVKTALDLSEDISEAGEAVDQLAGEAKLLALNATIEAARLGGTSGSAFGVISEEMNQLSNQIASTNRMIGETIQAIRESLPAIMKQTNEQNEKLGEFMTSMQQLKEMIRESMSNSGESGNTHLEMIVSLSYSALSHLQFQDPMIQKLQKIDQMIKDLHKNVNHTLEIEDESQTSGTSEYLNLGDHPEYQPKPGEKTTNQNPGDVLLF